MSSPLKVVIDECVGVESRLFGEFRAWLGTGAAEFLFLAETHPGIPDVEILDKLLGPGVVLLTNDCVLHNRACASKRRSFTLNEQQQLTRRPLKNVRTPRRPTAPSVLKQIKPSYASARHEIAQRLMADLPGKRLKGLRTARRRIRSYFGSSANISRVALTIGTRRSRGRVLCGYELRIAGHTGVKGLAASEGYCTVASSNYSEAHCLIHGLCAVFCLYLDQTPIDIFIMPGKALNFCQHTLDGVATSTAGGNSGTLKMMLGALPLKFCAFEDRQQPSDLRFQNFGGVCPDPCKPHQNSPYLPAYPLQNGKTPTLPEFHLFPCVKGRFFDAMTRKLERLVSGGSNEVRSIDFDDIARRLASPGSVT